MGISEKVAYLKGLMEGMNLNADSNEGKLFLAIADVLDEIALEVEDLTDEVMELGDGLDVISDDLGDVEDIVYDEDEDDYEDEEDDEDDLVLLAQVGHGAPAHVPGDLAHARRAFILALHRTVKRPSQQQGDNRGSGNEPENGRNVHFNRIWF